MTDTDTIMTPVQQINDSNNNDLLYNPLAFDLKSAIRQFLPTLLASHDITTTINVSLLERYVNNPTTVPRSHVLNTLSICLFHSTYTRTMISLFRPIVLDLVARWATPAFIQEPNAVNRIEWVAKAFSIVLPIVPQVKSLAVTYFINSPSLFERLTHLPHNMEYTTSTTSSTTAELQDLLLTTYRLLSFSTSTFAPLWNWGPMVELLKYSDDCVRYLTILCLSKAYGLSDLQTKSLLKSFNEKEEPIMMIIDGTRVNLRMLQLWEEQNLAQQQLELTQNDYPTTTEEQYIQDKDLSSLTCNLCGVLLPKTINDSNYQQKKLSNQQQLILTETTTRNLNTLSLALSIGAPTFLEGVTGAGKTSIVEELAYRTGRADQLIKIHLGDQTDPKVLLGTYVSTSTPGSFRWQAGVLTTAVQEGRWVLIEDIDLAPAEVISVLLPLLETRQLFIPSRGEKITAKEGFQLFGTRSYIPSRNSSSKRYQHQLVSGANLWTRVHIEPLSMEELETVVRQKFSHIGNFAIHVMRLFQAVINIYQDPNFSTLSTMGRYISTRDLMKWCYRINTRLNTDLNGHADFELAMDMTIREDLFSEAVDCFCGMIPDYPTWVTVLERVGEPLQLSPEYVRNYVDQRKPALRQSSDLQEVVIGRADLSSIHGKTVVKRGIKRPFATTGHALRLLERISVCVLLNEPTLLVGETGTGKTTVVQQLADMLNQNLVVVNLSQQSDSSDLLGGFKPVEGKILAMPLKESVEDLFERTFKSDEKNLKFLDTVRKAFVRQNWKYFVALLQHAIKTSQVQFTRESKGESKKLSPPELRKAWKNFQKQVEDFQVQQTQAENNFVFNFMEGSLVKAVRRGDWILLDEINLATTETLECLSGLLQDAEGSLLLTEKGDVEPIQRHPNFRLFACMNPATDVGKRDLPPGLRNRFTEFYVHPPDQRYEDLLQIVRRYMGKIAVSDERSCDDVAEFYLEAKKLTQQHQLVDGANQRPHFSMRTLSRALTYVVQIYPTYGLRRSLYEGFCMTFLTQLNKESEVLMRQLIYKTILRGVKNPAHLISQIPAQPSDNFIQFGYFWLEQGQFDPNDDGHYILTQSVETNLYNLARVIMSRKFPVLIQGPTSAGKTSMIEYLAKKTGHRFVRINNHEHTDLQEYLGTYVSNSQGKLVFQEGVLVEALRNGYWIVLDELNLAPSDVLEALNRLLDDNRELLIPETQEIVKPHPHFMLFATQNPAGLYGGRKALSRAFRNRFLELHFDDIPQDELEMILSQRCQIAPSYCKKLVQVYKSLMEHRKSSRLFEQKHSFITLRDLFRWAGRDPNGYQELAEHGYMLLAERCRKDEEKKVVKHVLETVMKVQLDENVMYDCERLEEFAIYDKILREKSGSEDTKLVWTKAMRRLFSLVARCLRYKEPVLLVGDTGCGKTTVCQMLAETFNRELHIVNCHQNTETGDLLGGQRPVRHHTETDQLFEWHDGPLVQALRDGHLFLLDEISLADDSVLERLNSVLEPSRLLVLAEKGAKHVEELYGQEGFQFLATMNPGGDYGKKELSPALRNRFTEIWVPSVTDRDDLTMIIDEQLAAHPALKGYGGKMLDFIEWFTQSLGQTRTVVSLRDILSWVRFIQAGVIERHLDPDMTFSHGGCLVLLDGLGSHGASGSFLSGDTLREFRLKCLRKLANVPDAQNEEAILGETQGQVLLSDDEFSIGPFQIERGSLGKADIKFTLLAPTTGNNAMRVARAMQLKKPILLEGSPGVGKTSLVSALAAAAGHRLVRINLSEQTDLMDLFGSDLPVEGGDSGEFAWRDAPFLQAMKQGDWVLLDELNLASQSVLEGLNSCLDHRGAVYIPELDREFFCAQGFRVFGAQNPLQQGGGRKGLPKSFVNRFTQVYVEHLTADDLLFICGHLFPQFDSQILKQMIEFNTHMYEETMVRCRFGRKGSPWEFNLRDVFRWLELMQKDQVADPSEYLETIYLQRMRTREDRAKVIELYQQVFDTKYTRPVHPSYHVTPNQLEVGHSRLPRLAQKTTPELDEHVLHTFLSPLEALMKCVESGWMAIVTGPSASGKTSLVRLLSRLTGNRLQEFAMNNSVDTMELLGGFEQVDLNRHRQVVMDALERLTSRLTRALLMTQQEESLQHVRNLNDVWFTLKTQQHMLSQEVVANQQQLDYALLENIVEQLNQASQRVDPDAMTEIKSMVEAAKTLQQLEKSSVAGKFEWIDGLLIHALEQGHWLLIDNANLCNPSVLDRLNPLFENDGVLMVNERGLIDGQVKVIKPHPNFRMFMTVDPNNGELSRAMRNRGIEISLVDANWNTTDVQDAAKLVNGLGLRGSRISDLLNELQATANASLRSNKGSIRDYLMLATYVVERLERGQSLKAAIQASYHHVFMEHAPEIEIPDLLEQALSPTNCPYFIGGATLNQDSNLATVTIQGAYLLYLLQQSESDERRIEVAMDYFLEGLLGEDANLRLQWLAYIAEHASLSNPSAVDRVMQLLKSVCNHPVFHKYAQDRSNKNLHKAYALVIRLSKNEHAVEAVQKASKRLKLGSMTALQQSYSFHDGRLTEAQLLHPIVKKITPFFTTVDYTLSQWLTNKSAYESCNVQLFDRLQQILDTRDFAWRIADGRPLSLDNYLNVLRLIQALVQDLEFAKVISDMVDDTMAGFDFETCRSMKALWQYFAPATLASQSLFDVEQELHKLSAQMDSYQHSDQNLIATDRVLHTSLETKETIVEGLATLYAVDQNDDKQALKLGKSLTQLPEHIKRQLEKDESTNNDIKHTAWDTALIPLLDYTSTVKEMELVGDLYMAVSGLRKDINMETLVKDAKSLKSLALNKTSRPPLDMVPYQRLAWALDSTSFSKLSITLPGMIQDAVHVWHRRLWRSSVFQQSLYQLEPTMRDVIIPISDGPQNLYQSVETIVCLNLLSFVEKMSAEAYENAVKQLKALRKFLATNVNLRDRKAIEIIMLISSAYQILEAAQPVLHPIFYNEMHEHFERLDIFIDQLAHADLYNNTFTIDYDDAFTTFNSIVSSVQAGSLNKYYIASILSLTDAIRHYRNKNNGSFFASIGKARTLMGLAFVTAYVPDYPVDPTAEPRLRVDLLQQRKDTSLNDIDVRTHIEKIITGNDDNATIQEQQNIVDCIDNELSASSTTFSLRPQKSQLDDIFVDLTSLQKNLLASNTESLINALMQSDDNNKMAIQREQLLQGNVIQFIDRIHVKYPMYRDILQPLLVAVDDVKYGLRLMVSTTHNDRADAYLSQVVSLFIQSPSTNGESTLDGLDWHQLTESLHLAKLKAIVFERAPTSRKWAFYLSILVTVLQRLVMAVDTHGYLSENDLSAINTIFTEIVQVWKAAEEYKREKEAEKEQMYKTRTKKYEPMTEEEQEEADKKKLFADFNESFADLEDSNEDVPPATTSSTPKVEEESVLDDKDIQRIGELHKYIFNTFHVDTCKQRTANTQNYDRELLRSYGIAAQLASMSTSAFDNSVDIHCNAGHLQATTISLQRLEATNSFSKTSDALYDFYTSENVGEAKKVQPVVQRFKSRVEHIQQEWPDHAVLQQLIVISDRLLGFSIVSPVAKFLTGIELLLQKSEDWEAYAAKHVSLSAQREELIQLIVQWRQLELNCWPTLLAAQEQYSQNAAYTWWFHLFDTVNNTSFNDNNLSKQGELIGALDHFFQTCSLIEFEPRLEMLDSFARQARVQAELSGAKDQWSVATLLSNVCAYYTQFTSHVQLMLSQLRKPIEKDLKESVKIATWKDVNIHALRQSAYKTHKQLHKCIRKYREALGTSMLTVIANYNQEHAMFQYGDEKRYNDVNKNFIDQLGQPALWLRDIIVPINSVSLPSGDDQIKRHLQDLPSTLNKMRRYCREDVLKAPEDIPLENFMTQVIEQIKSFQKETPALMTDENKSMVKTQKLLKKKALVDFLKELRRLGLKSRPGTLAAQNADTAYLFSQHVAALDTVLHDRHLQKNKLSSFVSVSQDMIQLWQKANDYYYRSIARVSHLRKLCTTEVSKDLSRLEVERSMSATEHMFSLVHKERTLAGRFEERIQVLQSAAIQLASLYGNDDMEGKMDQALDQQLVQHKKWMDDLVDMVTSAVSTLSAQSEYVGMQSVSSIQQLHSQLANIQRTVDRCFIQRYLSATHLDSAALLTADVKEMIISNESTIKTSIRPAFETIMDQMPQMTHVIQAILSHMDHHASISTTDKDDISMTTTTMTAVTLRDQLYSMIDAILVSIQDLKKVKSESQSAALKAKEVEDEDEMFEMSENYIRDQHNEQFTLTQALHMDTVTKRCLAALVSAHELLSTDEAQDSLVLLQQAYPFVQQYMLIIQHTLSQFLAHHKAMSKMTYALINSFTIIISKGFCMPSNAEEEGEEGEADGTTMGTGIGEGEGTKDVSDEIEDEEQVLGTQNEEQRKQEKSETKEEKKGMEMENDFEGELEDVDPDEDDQQDNDDDDDESDEDELDDEIGDVDDMDAVDDKMWGDDEDHDERKDTDKTVDQQGQQQQQESDIVAKEEEEDESQEPQSKGEKPERQENGPDQKQEDDQEGGDDNDDEQEGGSGDEREEDAGEDDEGAEENRAGEQMNVEVPEAETLELPEDLEMDGGEEDQQEGGQEEEFFDPMDMDEEKKEGADEEMGEEEGEQFQDPLDQVGEGEQQNNEDDEMADAAAHVPDQEDEGEGGDENEENKDQEEENTAGDKEQTKGGQIDENEEEEEEKGTSHNREHPNDDNDAADNQFGVQGQTGKMSSTSKGKQQGEDEAAEEDERNDDEQPPDTQQQQGMAERGTNQANDDDNKNEEDEEDQAAEAKTNPQRSLGDALESWRRRLADVADAEEEEEDEDVDQEKKDNQDDSREAQVNDDHAFEYIKNDDEAHDLQTMGNAAADQLQDINMGAMDDTTQDEDAQAGEMDIDNEEKQDEQVDTMPLPQESMEDLQGGDKRGAILSKRFPESQLPEEGEVLTMDESLIAHEPLDPEEIERMRQELETTVSEWREEGRDVHQARDLWQRYENLTHDLAMGLCEQLRLILEPTLATKLKGDYRTGKRLNMKKIIPYIASQFKKDKIWLRRTKPSKRQYQVMISIDDSKSMSESHSVQLAYEALSLISKALSQLEVGDISITSFGERIRLLHPFEQPFTSEAGASVLQQFTFAQQKTNVKQLIESSLSLFENAQNSSNGELWQLQLIISDGICDDHETLQRLVRQAMDQHVMLIFIVVDNKPEKDSILKMTNVKYATVNGKLTLQMRPYLETFPFQYFMVLRDINALPEALSDALRQYFSFVSA